jgi:hypothetical protein
MVSSGLKSFGENVDLTELLSKSLVQELLYVALVLKKVRLADFVT